VNYDDPAYSADRSEYSDGSIDDDVVDGYGVDATFAEIEAMREERRRKNDEYQFETYHASVLRGGERILGEWTVFQTDTFMGEGARDGRDPMTSGVPRLLKWDKVLKVVSRRCKTIINPRAEWRFKTSPHSCHSNPTCFPPVPGHLAGPIVFGIASGNTKLAF
jgi:hypothetical protein